MLILLKRHGLVAEIVARDVIPRTAAGLNRVSCSLCEDTLTTNWNRFADCSLRTKF
jgi:hypothetical protein